jgi:hypothetical protein
VSLSCDDGEPVVVENRCVRRARKQHKCCACRRLIEPGQLYAYNFLVWDGAGHTYRRCGACEKTWRHLLALCERYNEAERQAVLAWSTAWHEYSSGKTTVSPGACPYPDTRWPDERLACGLDYGKEWEGAPPAEIAALPFLSAQEASALLETRGDA